MFQISTVVRRAKDKVDAKSASYVEGFVAGLLPTFGSGIGLMPKESSLELREGNDTVIRYVKVACAPCFASWVHVVLCAGLGWCSTYASV